MEAWFYNDVVVGVAGREVAEIAAPHLVKQG